MPMGSMFSLAAFWVARSNLCQSAHWDYSSRQRTLAATTLASVSRRDPRSSRSRAGSDERRRAMSTNSSADDATNSTINIIIIIINLCEDAVAAGGTSDTISEANPRSLVLARHTMPAA